MPVGHNLGILSQPKATLDLTVFLQSSNGASGSSGTIGIPSVGYGDFIILFQYADGLFLDPADVNIPDLSDLFNNTDGSSVRAKASVKIADGNETSFSGMTDSNSFRVLAVFRRRNKPFVSYQVSTINQECTNGNPVAQTVTANNVSGPVIVFAFYASNGDVNPRSFSPSEDGEIVSTTQCYMKYKIFNDVGQDVIVDMDDETNENFLGSCYIQLS